MEEPAPSPFGVLLRQYRLEAGLTQAELAERAGLSTDAISTLERGARRSPHRDTVRLLANALELAPHDRTIFKEGALKVGAPAASGPRALDAPPSGNFLGALPSGPLVAREEELDRVQSILEAVAQGAGQLVLLAGELGAGKTRLAQEAMAEASARGFVVGVGRCYQPEDSTPYYPILEALVGMKRRAPLGMRADLQRRGQEIRHMVSGETTAGGGLRGSLEDRQRLFVAITECLSVVDHVLPVGLFLDDLHWADRASVELLQHLAHATRANRVLLLGTCRDVRLNEENSVLAQALQDLSRERLVERITVRRLAAEETAAMVAAIMGEVSEEFADFIHRRTKGNPRFIDQMVRQLGGRLRLLREIGAGAMGRVFEAEDGQTGKRVAAKLMLARGGVDEEALVRFRQEGAVLAALTHPNIVDIYDTFVEEHASCIIMELLDGRSLGQVLRAGPLPLVRAKRILLQVAAALEYAHAHAIAHRDIKPDNIMVVGDDYVKVTDFGIARILRPDATLQTIATTGMRVGTPLYMPPEQIEGKKIDGRADIYSLGTVMYHMVTGRTPFEGDDPLATAIKHLREEPRSPREFNSDLPADWEAVILKAMAKDPAHRFQTAGELESAIEALTVVAARPSPEPTVDDGLVQPAAPQHGNSLVRRLVLGGTAVLLLAIGGLILGVRSGASHGENPLARLVTTWSIQAPSLSLMAPTAIATDGWGNLYVADSGADQIDEISSSGQLLASWGSRGRRHGQLRDPEGLALDLLGNVYVADTGNNRIEKFSSRGRFLASFGERGTRPGQFRSPQGVAVGSTGTIYVADTDNSRIQALSAAGVPDKYWDPYGSQRFQLLRPSSLASYGCVQCRVLVVDPAAGTGQVLEGNGTFSFHWPSGLITPAAIVIDDRGNAYILDTGLQQIRKYDDHGSLVRTWHGPFRSSRGLAVDARGNMYVSDTGHHRVLKLAPTGTILASWGGTSAASPEALAPDARGDLYVADYSRNQIVVLSPAGRVLRHWKGSGRAAPLGQPSGVAVDVHGHVYVADTPNDRIVRFSPSGTVERAWGTSGSDLGQFLQPHGVRVDRQGHVYVVDSLNSRVEEFTATGALLHVWNVYETPPKSNPYAFAPTLWGMAIDVRGYIYLTDTVNDLIVEVSPYGRTVAEWGGTGSRAGELLSPQGVAIGPSGTIYVADTGNHRVEVFSPSGKFIGTFRDGLDTPTDLVVVEGRGAAGTLYVADSGSGRIERFSLPS